MSLHGQARNTQAGYALAVLLTGIAVMSIMLSVAMPVWHQQVQREKEAELIFRGEQYARAIVRFQHKYGAALPPNVDILVEQKFLRKKYKDPITGGDFQPIYQATASQPGTVPGQTAGTSGQPSTGSVPPGGSTGLGGDITGTMPKGGLIGVVSKSTAASIRIYNGFDHYNQWAFLYTQVAPLGGPGGLGGAGGGGTAQPGQPTPSTPPKPQPPHPQ